ncbi:MAG: alpha/beta fold hydrolase [Gammaproteobacteria bacterium]|nr:alpha/beta fold hydrolase [Gammaproteobacteria bacterium]
MSHALDTARFRFDPPMPLRHPHVQSILASSGLRARTIRGRATAMLRAAEPLVLDCGDGARLLGYLSVPNRAPRGLIVLLHGWEGSVESHYMISMAGRAFEAGFEVFRLNFRDHGGTHSLNRELFHSCRLDEVANAAAAIAERRARAATFVVGYSLGGNFALRVAAKAPALGLNLTKAVAICPVLKPHSTMEALERGFWIYREYFLRRWRRSLLAKAAAFPGVYDFGDLRRFRTLTETTAFFVQRYTEYPDLDSYLDGYAVTGDVLAGLTVPTWLIAARDDPVIPIADLDAVARSDALHITLAPRGGHCGFLEDLRLESWLDRCVIGELERAAADAEALSSAASQRTSTAGRRSTL